VVEVRSRSKRSFTTGFGSIAEVKRRRVRLAAQQLWRVRYARDDSVSRLRIDAATVTFDGDVATLEYCAAAF
jgi:Holliday junction resolvase-like predicted endonuclease